MGSSGFWCMQPSVFQSLLDVDSVLLLSGGFLQIFVYLGLRLMVSDGLLCFLVELSSCLVVSGLFRASVFGGF